jgi:hypothetical protein
VKLQKLMFRKFRKVKRDQVDKALDLSWDPLPAAFPDALPADFP